MHFQFRPAAAVYLQGGLVFVMVLVEKRSLMDSVAKRFVEDEQNEGKEVAPSDNTEWRRKFHPAMNERTLMPQIHKM